MANQEAKRDERQPQQGRPEGSHGQGEAPPFWEWVVAALGLLLVAGSIGYLTWAALTRSDGEVAPQLELVEVRAQDDRFLARVRVRNGGQATAEGLKVTGSLRRGEEELERSEVELQYLPGESEREVGLFFQRDPRQFRLQLAPESFRVP